MMELQDLIAIREELRTQARKIRTGSSNLSGRALAEAQQSHRNLMYRISQVNESIRNNY